MSRLRIKNPISVIGVLVAIAISVPAYAQSAQSAPDELEGVGVEEKLGDRLPLDLTFVNSENHRVSLREFFDGKTPVLLTMNYSNCPKLCHLQLNGLFDGLEGLDWSVGEKFRMITVSINPQETVERAAATKRHYLAAYDRPGAEQGWAFLIGNEANIKRLADSVGFHYRYDPVTQQYIHVAVTMVCTPDGRLSRYLYGVEYPAQTIRLALLEASEGKIGTTVDRILMFCFHYDPTRGSYTLAAVRLMQVGGLLTLGILGTVLTIWWLREKSQGAGHRNPSQIAETGMAHDQNAEQVT